MSDTRPTPALSHAELIVLGCLAQSTPPGDDELGNAVRELWLHGESSARSREAAMAALRELRQRKLVNEHKELTDEGRFALRTMCGLRSRPAWSTFRQRYLPAIVLGIPSAPPRRGKTPDTMVQEIAGRLGVPRTSSLTELCDALIADALQMSPGRMTLARIRAHIVALRAATTARASADDGARAPAVSAPALAAPEPSPRPVPPPTRALHDDDAVHAVHAEHVFSRERPETALDVVHEPPAPPAPASRAPEPAPDLLACVRDALPEVGAEGRFGPEKVFVSALWERVAQHAPPANLSLDHFKRWLVTANRNRWLTLARADVVGAMDPRQVRDSEIEDRGATFHFVLDPARNPAAQHGRSHVR
jgi:hypothetical protein